MDVWKWIRFDKTKAIAMKPTNEKNDCVVLTREEAGQALRKLIVPRKGRMPRNTFVQIRALELYFKYKQYIDP